MREIIITSFTDPVCVYCWATEAVYRGLETRYPGQIEYRHIAGGMVQDIYDFEDTDNHIDGRGQDVNAQIMAHWLESQPRHRMPVEPRGFALFSPQGKSSWPQNIAYKAAQIASPDKAGKYLRLLRLATFARAAQTGLEAVQVALAREAGVDEDRFVRALRDGSAQRDFQTDLGLGQALQVDVFPTFLVKSAQGRQMRMRGFNTRADFEAVFARLTEGSMTPLASPAEEEVLAWLWREHGPLAEEEVYQAFDFSSRAQARQWLRGLAEKGTWRLTPVGETLLVEPTADGAGGAHGV